MLSLVLPAEQFLGLFPVNPQARFRVTGGGVSFPESEEHHVVVTQVQPGVMAELGVEVVPRLVFDRLTVRVHPRSCMVGSCWPRHVFTVWADSAETILKVLAGA